MYRTDSSEFLEYLNNPYSNKYRVKIISDKINEIPETPYTHEIRELLINNTSIKEVPSLLSNLEFLSCDNTLVSRIYRFPKLRFISCENTPVKEIPDINSLEYVSCKNSLVEYIPNLMNLEHLNCAKCYNLKNIPMLPKIKFLVCNETIFNEVGITDAESYHEYVIYKLKNKQKLV